MQHLLLSTKYILYVTTKAVVTMLQPVSLKKSYFWTELNTTSNVQSTSKISIIKPANFKHGLGQLTLIWLHEARWPLRSAIRQTILAITRESCYTACQLSYVRHDTISAKLRYIRQYEDVTAAMLASVGTCEHVMLYTCFTVKSSEELYQVYLGQRPKWGTKRAIKKCVTTAAT